MDYAIENETERKYYSQDFHVLDELFDRIRNAFIKGDTVIARDLNLENIIRYDCNLSFTNLTVFYPHLPKLSWGSTKETFEDSINYNIEQIKTDPNFNKINFEDKENCRILLEFIIDQIPVKVEGITTGKFSEKRFEPGITGIKLVFKGKTYHYMPTESYVQSILSLNQALNMILRCTDIKQMSNKISERIEILKFSNYECYLTKSRAFVSCKDSVIPLYHGVSMKDYSVENIKEYAIKSIDWIIEHQTDDGKFLYYYDAKCDNYVDHEHPTRPENNLYYNDLRHCGGIISLIRAYQLTKDKKYLTSAKKAIRYIIKISKDHQTQYGKASYVYLNKKAKLGGTGLILAAMMKYRNETGEDIFDENIKKYTRHLISRVHHTGELMGYYIHPQFQDGNPLVDMNDEERKSTFSFYYPGEALLGLALFANYFDKDKDLRDKVLEKSELALDWLINERPKIYSDLFTALPSDAWLMQAIEEWSKIPQFAKKEYFDFVFNDTNTLMEKMYQKDNTPFIDYEGGYYYNYGDHFYPDGARSEGLIAAYYLAKRLNMDNAEDILSACQKAAKSQMLLVNTDKDIYPHLNPQKSKDTIRFKVTRQWARVDGTQHVACFYLRLLFAELNMEVEKPVLNN